MAEKKAVKKAATAQRRTFDKQFKAKALQLIQEKGKTINGVARDLQVYPGMIHRWKREAREATGKTAVKPVQKALAAVQAS